MLFAEYDRCQYARSPLVEVICQLRFPTILNIGAKDPAEFQEAVRHDFPRYMARQEQLPPKVKPGPTPALEPQAPITNYNFVSADGKWKLNLTSSFIALSTLRYQRWEDFAARLDKPLAQFIQIYQPCLFRAHRPAVCQRIFPPGPGAGGAALGRSDPGALSGHSGGADVEETDVSKCAVDVESALAGGYRMKLHAGPGLLGGGQDRQGGQIYPG